MIGTLSHEQARFYRDQGYFKLPKVYTSTETAEMRSFVNREAESEKARTQRVGAALVKMYGLYDRQPDLMHKIVTNPVLSGALQSLLGPHVVMVKNRHNHATVNDHQGAPPEGLHRDILQPTRGLLTAIVYLENATPQNGCTHLIPGSHTFPYVGVPQPDGGGTWLAEHEEYHGLQDQAVPVPVDEGGILLFDGLVFHGVGVNVSGETRMSMTFGFRSVDELEYEPDPARLVLVAGETIYRGNDRTGGS